VPDVNDVFTSAEERVGGDRARLDSAQCESRWREFWGEGALWRGRGWLRLS
jgi:hypothetical protein